MLMLDVTVLESSLLMISSIGKRLIAPFVVEAPTMLLDALKLREVTAAVGLEVALKVLMTSLFLRSHILTKPSPSPPAKYSFFYVNWMAFTGIFYKALPSTIILY